MVVGREQMRSRFGIFFCSVALLQILGGHWAFFQTGAWIGMVVQYSQEVGLKAALGQTFDGQHPCSVCKAIQDGEKQEQKKAPLLQAELKKDYVAVCHRFQVHQAWIGIKYPWSAEQLLSIATEPSVPPPRS
jgi:hypothetical protein